MDRRDFIKKGSAATLLSFMPAVIRPSEIRRYRTALIGSGWWGMNIARTALASKQNDVIACCDVDQRQLDAACQEFDKLTGARPRAYQDYRELLHTEKPEIVIVATPDHWHALPAIAAMQAGADVYLEKPVGHTIAEGQAMVKTARKYGRMVQVGTHRRVSPHNKSAIQFMQEGKLGKIGMVRTFVHYSGGPGKAIPDQEPPEHLDWDFWCGPAPYRSFNPRIHPKGFRRFLDYANGILGDWGIHWLDHILWWSEEKYPQTVYSTADRHILKDNTDAPDHQVVTYQFESFTATWEHRLFGGNDAEKHHIGSYFYGTEGTLHLGWLDGWTFYPSKKSEKPLHEEPQLHEPDRQNIPELWDDFMSSVRTRQLPVCDIEIGHRSTNMSLLGMLSWKAGRSIRWDGEKERIIDDPEANRLLKRDYRDPWVYPG
ncbi:gfo/Idh/MocA family oxidoreductase [candidate division KSB1 bacterium]|nr:gfo/Idh/MocA family oxidoreductase [candidate division KSB1 bacterium]